MAEQQVVSPLVDAQRKVEAALKLLDSETADAIIGDQPEEEAVLVKGVQAVLHMLWAMMKLHGVKENDASLKAMAQAILMVATIVHYAYALGVKRGND